MSKYIISAGALIVVIVSIISKYRFSGVYRSCMDGCDFDSRVKENWKMLILKAVWIVCLVVLIYDMWNRIFLDTVYRDGLIIIFNIMAIINLIIPLRYNRCFIKNGKQVLFFDKAFEMPIKKELDYNEIKHIDIGGKNDRYSIVIIKTESDDYNLVIEQKKIDDLAAMFQT